MRILRLRADAAPGTGKPDGPTPAAAAPTVASTRAATAATMGPSAVTIGNFDGVHRGHRAMLDALVASARPQGLVPTVVTFEPHPREHFATRRGEPPPGRITPLRDKLVALAAAGIEQVLVLRFDDAMASWSPETFVQRVLVERLAARELEVGDDFRFGARRAGDVALLRREGERHGFTVRQMGTVAEDGVRLASSVVREALRAGDMAAASAVLGRPYALAGHVLHGRKLGRDLGFRTLNLRFGGARLAVQSAAHGIFVADVAGLVDGPPLPAVASLGVRPAVEQAGRVLLETHVLDWPASLGADAGYGRCIRVTLHHHLHGERPYPSLQALREGIAADVDAARRWWALRS